MNENEAVKAFDHSKHKHPKHAKAIEEMQHELSKHDTEKARFDAAIDLGCLQLQRMKTDGSTYDDVVEALANVVEEREGMTLGIKHGFPKK